MSDEPVVKIEVGFHVEVPTLEIKQLHDLMEQFRPGSVEYCNAWDELKALHTHFTGRLDGECAAYMNIAKTKAKQLYGM